MATRMPRALEERFREFTAEAESFSRAFVALEGPVFTHDAGRSAALNVELSKSVFGKWSIEILSVLYVLKTQGFEELRKRLGGISARVLSEKLRRLERQQLVARLVIPTRPARVRYSLTPDGLTIAKLGEPVFLFLRSRRDEDDGDDATTDWAGERDTIPSSVRA